MNLAVEGSENCTEDSAGKLPAVSVEVWECVSFFSAAKPWHPTSGMGRDKFLGFGWV